MMLNPTLDLDGRISEREFQAQVMDLARLHGWRVAHHHDSRRQVRPGVYVGDADAAGFPDLVLVRGHRVVFAELKAERGRTTSEQDAWLDALAATGCVDAFLWRPSDWDAIVRELR